MRLVNQPFLATRTVLCALSAALPLTLLTACDRDPSDPPRPTTNDRIDNTNRAPSSNPATPLPPSQSPSTPGSSSGTGSGTGTQ